MRRPIHALALLASALVLQGCAGPGTSGMVATSAPPPPGPNEATLIFMRDSFIGSSTTASLYDVTGSEAKFLGFINNKTKIALNVRPGEHTYMVVSEAADFMKATVAPGKTYYAMVTPRMGVWKVRFSLKPVRLADMSDEEFMGWESNTQYFQKSPDAEAWAHTALDVQRKRAEYWAEWQQKPAEDQAEVTLNADDGR